MFPLPLWLSDTAFGSCFHCLRGYKTPFLPCVSTAFVAKTRPLPRVSCLRGYIKTRPLPLLCCAVPQEVLGVTVLEMPLLASEITGTDAILSFSQVIRGPSFMSGAAHCCAARGDSGHFVC